MTDLRELLNAATPPPWKALTERGTGDTWISGPRKLIAVDRVGHSDAARTLEDAALIVALVNQAHTLLNIAEAAQTEGVQYALRWINDGRPKSDPRRRDIDAFLAALACLDQKQTP